ncbi:Na/Pi cotransporter family protein [Leptolyngbyaceae cyanobacterium CCMR0082]|uniref:Na/Pi cotransporter family protein n=2 Tax=Adonisia turfae TaxID=2950184 RepID=A0A6M0RZH9_9CYAN|nr:Na/Pi symporter [Adonisia turfae]NEZ58624.1 Na/Pi cotransporter family protein [Adonisia turfae CCMR0081]NEZ61614.1 Na/Pi cotransporter family protein [Adonisia turfae CCMR0082]
MATSSSQSDSNALAETDKTTAAATDLSSTANAAAETLSSVENSPLESQTPSLGQSWLYAGGILTAIYGLFASIDLLNLGFQSIFGPQIESWLNLAATPWLGLLLGILATALVQSSSIITTLLVGLVAGGLPLATAIPMVMGANVGTTITNTLVSLGYLGSDDEFERGFAAATIHDCFNLLALVIFFPIELWLHPLERLSQILLEQSNQLAIFPTSVVSPIDWLLQPVHWVAAYGINTLSGPWDALLLFGTSVGGLMICVTALGWLMKHWLSTFAKETMYWALGHGSKLGALLTGTGLTAVLQSSSMTTSLVVPLAAAEITTLESIYPFVLGANIGTCITALIATLAVDSPVALQLAIVHLSFNLAAVILIYSIPALRSVPLALAQQLATATRNYRIVAIGYVMGLFFLLPFLALWLSSMLFA